MCSLMSPIVSYQVLVRNKRLRDVARELVETETKKGQY